MNVLLFVISLAMVMTWMTYGRLDMYRNFIVTQGEFERYMETHEREPLNQGAEQWYDWTHLQEKNGGSRNPAPVNASRHLSIYGLLHPEIAQQNPTAPVYRDLLKKLIQIIYGNQKKFKEALDKNHNLVDELLNAIQEASNKLNVDKKPVKTVDGLENLVLDNPQLQDIFYWMTKGVLSQNKPEKPTNEPKPLLEIVDETSSESEPASNSPDVDEHFHQMGTISLLDFLTVKSNINKIRVYLAPTAVLTAVFADSATVEELKNTRMELYSRMRQGSDSKGISEEFRQKFVTRALNVPESMLDFTVTTTDPQKYEIQ